MNETQNLQEQEQITYTPYLVFNKEFKDITRLQGDNIYVSFPNVPKNIMYLDALCRKFNFKFQAHHDINDSNAYFSVWKG